MPNALAGLASLLWGCSDFFGGLAAKSWVVQRVGVVMQAVSLAIISVLLVVFPADPSASDLGWGLVAGVVSAVGITLLYRSLAIGPMHVVAPTTAVVGAMSNVIIGVIGGERPSALTTAGVCLALVAVALVGSPSPAVVSAGRSSRRVVLMAAGAGLALGVLNASFAATSTDSGLYPVGVSRLVALVLLGVAALVTARDAPVRGEGAIGWSMAAGVADVGATICIALALQRGSLVLVGVLGALFPAVTVLLARAFLAERMGRWQLVGLVCAIVAVALMSSG